MRITDREVEFLSESSVYRILKAADLIESPAYILLQAADRFQNPTLVRNELWQTDFTYLPVVGWGWYYLGVRLSEMALQRQRRFPGLAPFGVAWSHESQVVQRN